MYILHLKEKISSSGIKINMSVGIYTYKFNFFILYLKGFLISLPIFFFN
jgi:hypothetical protein